MQPKLCNLLSNILTAYNIIGTFNVRVGDHLDALEVVLRKYGVGQCNENEYFHLVFGTEYKLCITNT